MAHQYRRLGGGWRRTVIRGALMAHASVAAGWAVEDAPAAESWWTKERKVVAVNLALDGGVLAYGISTWDWGSNSFTVTSEGWFGADTRYGGADKLGHAYTGYLISDLLADRYQAWGYDDATAALMGAGSSAVFTTLVELGDGLSKEYGFSGEDLAMNLAGAAFSWARQRAPRLAGLIDFRIEYLPTDQVTSGEDLDVTTDYDGMKYLLAFKLSGLSVCHDSWWRFLELHAGYYTRGYGDPDESDRRIAYGAIGLNVGQVVAALWGRTVVFDYYQVPYTYLPLERELSERP